MSKKSRECPSISPNGRVCILAAPHRGCPHESVGLPDGTFEEWTTKQQYKKIRCTKYPKALKTSLLEYIESRIKKKGAKRGR